MASDWKASSTSEGLFEGLDCGTGEIKWTATRVDLVFGFNSQLRAIAEVYASADSKEIFVKDFAAAWNKTMNLDCYDLHKA
jgi:catalase-peroxidase